MLTVRGQQRSFSTRTDVFVKVSHFLRQKNISTWEGLEPPIFRLILNYLNIWAIRARHLLPHVSKYWLWRYRYFWSKVNTWNAYCARATAFIFDTRNDVLVKVSKILRQKISRPEGDLNPQPSDSIARACGIALGYTGCMRPCRNMSAGSRLLKFCPLLNTSWNSRWRC